MCDLTNYPCHLPLDLSVTYHLTLVTAHLTSCDPSSNACNLSLSSCRSSLLFTVAVFATGLLTAAEFHFLFPLTATWRPAPQAVLLLAAAVALASRLPVRALYRPLMVRCGFVGSVVSGEWGVEEEEGGDEGRKGDARVVSESQWLVCFSLPVFVFAYQIKFYEIYLCSVVNVCVGGREHSHAPTNDYALFLAFKVFLSLFVV